MTRVCRRGLCYKHLHIKTLKEELYNGGGFARCFLDDRIHVFLLCKLCSLYRLLPQKKKEEYSEQAAVGGTPVERRGWTIRHACPRNGSGVDAVKNGTLHMNDEWASERSSNSQEQRNSLSSPKSTSSRAFSTATLSRREHLIAEEIPGPESCV
ncbi:unnamed protein product [Leptidea sinapis]|uniref:Uncharacterized protein n=1 Tax=Leptidea sinapis TaxID=189913 RepID=A0A5E4QDQ3_9NEOP|nr:unnamed protein product [Leptidea sinapis]